MQPHPPNLRGLLSLCLPLHLWYVSGAVNEAFHTSSLADISGPADAVPKKRGPKTDVLEALLKRVDGLEKRLHSEGKSDVAVEADSPTDDSNSDGKPSQYTTANASSANANPSASQSRPLLEIAPNPATAANQLMSPVEPRCLYMTL